MASSKSVHMNPGEAEVSYARNSTVQNAEQNRMKPIIEEAVISLLESSKPDSSMVITDLGCSSGPNALALVSTAVDAMIHHCRLRGHAPQEICVLLNDLPDNDFNNVARRLVEFQQRFQSFCQVVTGIVPGSFHRRLFTSHSLNLVLSSNSLHWLSEAPEDLRKNGIPVYDNDEDVRRARRPRVLKAYAQQFRKDFTLFLKLRAQEMAPGGRILFSLIGWSADNLPTHSNLIWDYVMVILNDMASRGVICREKVDSFYVPVHGPSDKELREIIEDERSFKITKMQVHDFMSVMDTGLITPKMWALRTRAIFEPIISQHFGQSEEVMDEFMRTLEYHMTLRSFLDATAIRNRVSLCLSLTKSI
ncbi:hypothetical protein ACP4OV_020151 [Aristida adscensionis]